MAAGKKQINRAGASHPMRTGKTRNDVNAAGNRNGASRRSRPEKPMKQAANKGEAAKPETIQWFPGHMARTRRKIQESLSLVDAVVEIVDARIPVSSRNPELSALIGKKPRLIVLNKADLADEAANNRWVAYYRRQGTPALLMDSRSGRGFAALVPALRELLHENVEKWESRGMNRAIRVMVVGIPNVGKSSFINRLNKGGKAKVEDRPGVTRMNQWFVTDGLQLLDTPGVLWPKFEDHSVALHLAFTGAIKDQVLDMEELACELLGQLAMYYRPLLCTRYKLTDDELDGVVGDNYELLQLIARRRGMLLSGGELNTERAAIMLLDEFRDGKLGRISLEQAEGEGGVQS